MENPWAKLPPNAPFVLPEDRKAICDFNEKADEQHKIRLDLLPEPFSGNPEGAIVLLNLNPGYDQGDHQFHSDSAFASSLRKALCHEQQEYPLHLLNPSFCKAPGYQYWRRHLKWLVDQYGNKTVANELLLVEYFPYHSCKYRSLGQCLDSQRYNFFLVEKAIQRQALIVMLRHKKQWLEDVPGLNGCRHLFTAQSAQAGTVSPRNTPEAAQAICKLLG